MSMLTSISIVDMFEHHVNTQGSKNESCARPSSFVDQKVIPLNYVYSDPQSLNVFHRSAPGTFVSP